MSGFILKRGKAFAAAYKEFDERVNQKSVFSAQTEEKEVNMEDDVKETKPVIKVNPAADSDSDTAILSDSHSQESNGPESDTALLSDEFEEEIVRFKPLIKPEPIRFEPMIRTKTRAEIKAEIKSEIKSDIVFLDDSPRASSSSVSTSTNLSTRRTKMVSLKLKFNGNINRFTVDANEPLWKNMSTFCKSLGISKKTHELVITHNDKVLSFHDTPRILKLSITDILEAYAKERTDSDATQRKRLHKEAKDPNQIEIKLRHSQDNKHDLPVIIVIAKTDTMDKLMQEYASRKGYNLSDLIFEFDGDRLTDENTPDDLDMEDGSLIDVRFKTTASTT